MSLLFSLLFTIISYNCENLFDCRHDSLKNDVEFLPDAERHLPRGLMRLQEFPSKK